MEKVNKMTQIDTSKWGKFRIGDLFAIYLGDYNNPKFLTEDENGIPLVSATTINNGISGYYKKTPDLKVITKNKITWGKQCPYFCYQATDFITGQGTYYLDVSTLSFYTNLFVCAVLNNEISQKYDYNNCLIGKKLSEEIILLPITTKGSPDWQFMENYMKEITKLAAKRVEKLKEEKIKYKIDISNWGNFRVGDLFEIKLSKNDIRFERCNTGSTPLISAGNENNGIVGYIDKEDFEVFPANSITVNVFGKAFVQTKDFCASVNILIIRNEHLTKNIGMFIAAILSKSHSKYNYNDQISKNKLFNETISLPVTPEGTPDFDYMENYIKNLTKLAAKRVEKLKEEKPQTKIDTSNWKKFKVGDLFDVTNGKKYPSSIRQTGELPLISTTANNNGISDYIKDRNDGVYSNCITVAYSGSVGATFYHKEKVFVGETVIALLPKFKMNQYSGLFICSILSKINSKFSYTQKIKVLQYKNEAISLPVTPEGTPDFDYMENYMKNIEDCTNNIIEQAKKKI